MISLKPHTRISRYNPQLIVFAHLQSASIFEILLSKEGAQMFKSKAKVVVEVSSFDLRLMRESLLALRDRLISEGRYTAPVDEMLARLFA